MRKSSSKTKAAFVHKLRTSDRGNPNYVIVTGDFVRGPGGKIRTLRTYKSALKLADAVNGVSETKTKTSKKDNSQISA